MLVPIYMSDVYGRQKEAVFGRTATIDTISKSSRRAFAKMPMRH